MEVEQQLLVVMDHSQMEQVDQEVQEIILQLAHHKEQVEVQHLKLRHR